MFGKRWGVWRITWLGVCCHQPWGCVSVPLWHHRGTRAQTDGASRKKWTTGFFALKHGTFETKMFFRREFNDSRMKLLWGLRGRTVKQQQQQRKWKKKNPKEEEAYQFFTITPSPFLCVWSSERTDVWVPSFGWTAHWWISALVFITLAWLVW